MTYKLHYEDWYKVGAERNGTAVIDAPHDPAAQSQAREFLRINRLLPQHRKNYLYRIEQDKGQFRSVEVPF